MVSRTDLISRRVHAATLSYHSPSFSFAASFVSFLLRNTDLSELLGYMLPLVLDAVQRESSPVFPGSGSISPGSWTVEQINLINQGKSMS